MIHPTAIIDPGAELGKDVAARAPACERDHRVGEFDPDHLFAEIAPNA